MCSQRRLRSNCDSSQSDQFSVVRMKKLLHHWLSKMSAVTILIRLRMCSCPKARFLTLRPKCLLWDLQKWYRDMYKSKHWECWWGGCLKFYKLLELIGIYTAIKVLFGTQYSLFGHFRRKRFFPVFSRTAAGVTLLTNAFSAARYMIGPLFSTKSIWLTQFFLIGIWKPHLFWHPGICTCFSLRDFLGFLFSWYSMTALFV